MSVFEIPADQDVIEELGVAVLMLADDHDRSQPRKGVMLTQELVEDAFGGDRDRAAQAVRSGLIDHEAMRRIDGPDRLVYQPHRLDAADASPWMLAAFTRDDLGLFEGPVRSGGTADGSRE